jgi:hypothetical protein
MKVNLFLGKDLVLVHNSLIIAFLCSSLYVVIKKDLGGDVPIVVACKGIIQGMES